MQKRFSHDVWALGKDINAIRTRRRKLRGVAKWQGGLELLSGDPEFNTRTKPKLNLFSVFPRSTCLVSWILKLVGHKGNYLSTSNFVTSVKSGFFK